MALEVRVLGGVGLTVDGCPVALPRRVQLLLALLVAHRADGLDPDVLIEELYAGTPPSTAPAAVRVHLAKLRDALEPDRARGASTRIGRTHGRWRLRLEPEESDVGRFESAAAEGAQVLADADPALAATLFETARAQWQGEPYPGLDSAFIGSERERLSRLRRDLDRRYLRVLLDLGRAEEALARVRGDREDDPFDEQLVALEARAHYQLSGAARGLQVLRDFREELADQLGLDPSALIDQTEAALLRNDPGLLARALPGSPTEGAGASSTPTHDLIGREDLLAAVAARRERHSVVCLEGVAGVGKTSVLRAVAPVSSVVSARAAGSAAGLVHDLLRSRGIPADAPGWSRLRAHRAGLTRSEDAAELPLILRELTDSWLTDEIFLDDAEALDEQALDLLAARVASGVRLVCAHRPGGQASRLVERMRPAILQVAPLTPEHSRRLAARLRPDHALSDEELAATGGLPLLIEYAVQGGHAGPGLAGRLLDGLTEAARAAAETLAVLGAGLPMSRLIDRAGADAVEELLVVGVVDSTHHRVWLAHPVLAEAIRSDLGPLGVRRRLEELLSDPRGVDALTVWEAVDRVGAVHFAESHVALLQLGAAEEALAVGDAARAVELISALTPGSLGDDALAARAELTHGRALIVRGDTAPARGHLARAGQLFRSVGDAASLVAALEPYVGLLAPEAAEGLLIDGHAAWLLARDEITPDQRVLIRELQSMIPDPEGFHARTEALLDECDRAGSALAGLVSLMARWRFSFEMGGPARERLLIAESAASLADQLGERNRLVRALRNQIDDLIAAGDRRQYRQRLERLRAFAATNYHAEARWWCEVMEVGIALREQPDVEAIHEATFAVHAAWPQIPDWWRDDMVLLHEAIAMYSCGRRADLLVEMAKLARGANPLEIEDRLLEFMVLTLRAELEGITADDVRDATEAVLAAPPRWRRPAELYLLGRAAIHAGLAEPRLITAITPYADTWVCIGTGAATFGPMAAVLAGLHVVAGEMRMAERYAAEAQMRCTDMAAPAWASDSDALLAAATARGWPERSLG